MSAQLTHGTWNLDLAHSEIGFSVRHAGISKVRGQFTDADATLVIGQSLDASSVNATISTASFDSKDKDITLPVEFDVEFGGAAVDPFGATRAGFSASTVISRKQFGITWNAALEAGGVLVGDKVTITVDAAFVQSAN